MVPKIDIQNLVRLTYAESGLFKTKAYVNRTKNITAGYMYYGKFSKSSFSGFNSGQTAQASSCVAADHKQVLKDIKENSHDKIVFFATWCHSCLPKLKSLEVKYWWLFLTIMLKLRKL